MNNRFILIMAGGIGSRFWPASTADNPKQFLDILGTGKSLIRQTFERALLLVPVENILIATGTNYHSLVKEHLPEVLNDQILLEPSRNNTAPCIAYAALKINVKNKNAVFAVWPSDHVILKENAFVSAMNSAFKFASINNSIVTLGIKPTRPDTGYGYIQVSTEENNGFKKVETFKEKPDYKTAQEYIASGNYFWNAGIFIWSVKTILGEFERNAPSILKLLSKGNPIFNTSEEQSFINEVYPLTENISVDYAILEQSDQVFTLPVDIGWSDLGTWNSLHQYLDKDESANVAQGETLSIDNKNCFIRVTEGHKAVVKGLEDYIVVVENGVLLIYPKSEEQDIKEIRKRIEND